MLDTGVDIRATSGGFGGTGNRSAMELLFGCSHHANASSWTPLLFGVEAGEVMIRCMQTLRDGGEGMTMD